MSSDRRSKHESSKRKQLMLFHGYYQNGQQVDITASRDGKGYQSLEPVYFATTRYAKDKKSKEKE